MSVNFNPLPKDILEQILRLRDFEDLLNFRLVDKQWHSIAENHIKEKLIPAFTKSIAKKSEDYFQMTSKPIDRACPVYAAKLKQIQEKIGSLSFKQVQEELDALTEKYHVHVAAIGEYDLSEKKTLGNQFVKFNYTNSANEIQHWGEIPSMAIPELKNYFPLKLFGESRKRVCFPLYGRLIELIRDFSLDKLSNTHRIYYPQSIYSPFTDANPPMERWKEQALDKLHIKRLKS